MVEAKLGDQPCSIQVTLRQANEGVHIALLSKEGIKC